MRQKRYGIYETGCGVISGNPIGRVDDQSTAAVSAPQNTTDVAVTNEAKARLAMRKRHYLASYTPGSFDYEYASIRFDREEASKKRNIAERDLARMTSGKGR